jgi:hypothetical protein
MFLPVSLKASGQIGKPSKASGQVKFIACARMQAGLAALWAETLTYLGCWKSHLPFPFMNIEILRSALTERERKFYNAADRDKISTTLFDNG